MREKEAYLFLSFLYYLLIHRVSGETFWSTLLFSGHFFISSGMDGMGWSVGGLVGLGLFRRSRLDCVGTFFSFFAVGHRILTLTHFFFSDIHYPTIMHAHS